MPLKNVTLTVEFMAWDTANSVGKTGDSGNFTLKVIKDGTSGAATNSPAEIDATNCPGLYKLVLTATEMNGNCICLHGKSSTANVVLIPVQVATDQGVLPTAAPNASGGLPTYGTGAGQINVDGAGNVKADVTKWATATPNALISGRVDANPGALQASVITAASIATDAITAAKVADGAIDAATFAAGAINAAAIAADAITAAKIADGAIDAATFAAGAIDAAAIATDAIGSAELAASAVSEIQAAVAAGAVASVTGAVGSVTGNVGGNVVGSVASVTAGVTLAASAVQAIWDALTSALSTANSIGKLLVDNINATISSRLASASITLSGGAVTVGTNNDKTGYTASAVSDKTGYSLSAGGVQAIWDALTSALTAAGSMGKLLIDNINATISSRLASSSYTAPDNSTITTIATNLTTALARLGSWTGSGVNTVLGGIAALASKTATAPSDIGGTFNPATDSGEAIRDRGDAAWVTGSGGGGASIFTLSQVAATVAAATADSGTLTARKAATWSQQLTGLGNIGSRTKLYFTVKARASDADSAALIQIEETAGLIRLAGAAGTANQGTLLVNDATLGNITLSLVGAAAAQLTPGTTYIYDVKMLVSATATVLAAGSFRVQEAVTLATT